MKRLVALVLAGVICLPVLASCEKNTGKEEPKDTEAEKVVETEPEKELPKEPLELETTVKVEGIAELSLISVTTDTKVKAVRHNGQFYENDKEGNVYVDAVFELVNLQKKAVAPQEIFRAYAVGEEKYNSVFYGIETEGYTSMSHSEVLVPGAVYRFHAAVSVPEADKALSLNYEFKDVVYTLPYTLGETVRVERLIEEGTPASIDGFADAEFVGYEFTDKILPSDTTETYSTYVCEGEGNTYLVLYFDLTNNMSDRMLAGDLLCAAVRFEGSDEYMGFVATENVDGRGFSHANKLLPTQTLKALCVIEVPEMFIGTDFEATVVLDSTEFILKIDADAQTDTEAEKEADTDAETEEKA